MLKFYCVQKKNVANTVQQNIKRGTSQEVQWLRLHLPMKAVRVQSLVEELRSHVPHSQKTKNIKQKQYCNKFNKD